MTKVFTFAITCDHGICILMVRCFDSQRHLPGVIRGSYIGDRVLQPFTRSAGRTGLGQSDLPALVYIQGCIY